MNVVVKKRMTVRGRQQHHLFCDWHRAIATPSYIYLACYIPCMRC
jgi:hypothetical protein